MKILSFIFCLVILTACSDNENHTSENNTPTKEKKTLKISEPEKEQTQEVIITEADIKIKVFDNTLSENPQQVQAGGFGYDIYIHDKACVHQPTIPAINGNRGFKTEEHARKVGELMVYKIKNEIFPPGVSREELDSLGIFN